MALLSTPRLFPTSLSHSSTPFSSVYVPRREEVRIQYSPVRRSPPPKQSAPAPVAAPAPVRASTAPAALPRTTQTTKTTTSSSSQQTRTQKSARSPQRSSRASSPRSSASSVQSSSSSQKSSASSVSSTSSSAMGGGSFHPFHGRVSKHFGDSSSKSSTPYLSYHDVLLTNEDISTLKDDWLTDNVIAFWEEYLEREELSQFRRANIVLLRPSMTFLLMQTQDPSTLKEVLPSFKNTTHIFLPINDCNNPAVAEGGSHWSLLLISLVDGAAFHYDSLHSANKAEAQKATRKVSQLLNKNLSFQDLEDSPQQENGTDCGVYVCLNMHHLLMRRLLKAQQGEKVSMSMGGREVDAKKGRKFIQSIIDGFVTEGERRRSASSSPVRGSKSQSPPRIE